MRRMMLGVLYYLLLTPIALLIRSVRDPLHRRWDMNKATYWSLITASEDKSRTFAQRADNDC
ncbi:hypothetical protein AB0M54_18765 [Actinoplanes sp. NPDC051470]|uniref:hypothetical protein n=1 Tax=unclassified Actinoplanes TaxID=2626549 RepID=UPI0034370D62